MRKNVLIILISILTFSCNSDDDNSDTVTIESTLIAQSNLTGSGDEGITEQNLIISDEATWDNLITQIDSINDESSRFSETDIDFSKYQIIVAFDEVKPNGGHSIELDITSNSENIIVNVTDIAPEGNATAVITQPFHIVKITKSDLPILFE